MFEKPDAEVPNIQKKPNDQDCSAQLLEDLLPNKKTSLAPSERTSDTKEAQAIQADRLIDAGDKELKDPNALPVNVRSNYQKALNIQEYLYGKTDEKLLPVLDRLTALSFPKEARQYKEQTIEILRANPHTSNIALASRYLDLANCCRTNSDELAATKYSALALSQWQQKATANSSEALGDRFYQKGNISSAVNCYLAELSKVENQVNEFAHSKVNTTHNLHANPLEIRLQNKLGDCYSSNSQLEKAAAAYSLANTLSEKYSTTHGDGQILSEQLPVIAKSLIVELKLTQLADQKLNDPNWKTNPVVEEHLANALALFGQLNELEQQTKIDQTIIENNYGQDDPQLFNFMAKVASYSADQQNYAAASTILERLNLLQTVKQANPEIRIVTLNDLAKSLYEIKDNTRLLTVYTEMINMACENTALFKILTPPPVYLSYLAKDDTLITKQIYSFGKLLTKAAGKLYSNPETQETAMKFLESALPFYNKYLEREKRITPETRAEMSNTLAVYKEMKGNKILAWLNIQSQLKELEIKIAQKD